MFMRRRASLWKVNSVGIAALCEEAVGGSTSLRTDHAAPGARGVCHRRDPQGHAQDADQLSWRGLVSSSGAYRKETRKRNREVTTSAKGRNESCGALSPSRAQFGPIVGKIGVMDVHMVSFPFAVCIAFERNNR